MSFYIKFMLFIAAAALALLIYAVSVDIRARAGQYDGMSCGEVRAQHASYSAIFTPGQIRRWAAQNLTMSEQRHAQSCLGMKRRSRARWHRSGR